MLWNSVNNYFKQKFGGRVHRVAVDAGFTCPNRDGSKSSSGCAYCDEEGARAAYVDPDVSVSDQLKKGIEHISRRFNTEKFIAYFQAYSNTYAPVEKLEKLYNEALSADDRIIGLAIGTRPDCMSDEKLDLLESLSKRTFLWVEYGLQSIDQNILNSMNRSDTVEQFVKVSKETAKRNIPVLAHIIFGFPDEKREIAVESAHFLNSLNVWGVKIHSLYLTKNSTWGQLYSKSSFNLISMEEYVLRAADFLENLNPDILIHRITSDVHSDKLLAPQWIKEKSRVLNMIEEELKKRNSVQGFRYSKK